MTEHVGVESPIKIYPDGAAWCALWGENIQEGLSGFGLSPELALSELLEQEDLWEHTPHGNWELTCPGCTHFAVHVMPYPFPEDSVKCHICNTRILISNDPPNLGVIEQS